MATHGSAPLVPVRNVAVGGSGGSPRRSGLAQGLGALARAFDPARNPALQAIINRNIQDAADDTEDEVARDFEQSDLKWWKEAVQANPTLQNKNPYYQELWGNRHGQRLSVEFGYAQEAKLSGTDLKHLDATALSKYLDTEFKTFIAPFINDDNIMNGVLENIGRIRGALVGSVQDEREKGIMEGNARELSLGLTIEMYGQKDWLAYAWAARADGVATGRTPEDESAGVLDTVVAFGMDPVNAHVAYAHIIALVEGEDPFLTGKLATLARVAAQRAADRAMEGVTKQQQLDDIQRTNDQRAWVVKSFELMAEHGNIEFEEKDPNDPNGGLIMNKDHAADGFLLGYGPKWVNSLRLAYQEEQDLNMDPAFKTFLLRTVPIGATTFDDLVGYVHTGEIPATSVDKWFKMAQETRQNANILERSEFRIILQTLRNRLFSARITQEGTEMFIFGSDTARVMIAEFQEAILAIPAENPFLLERQNQGQLSAAIQLTFQKVVTEIEKQTEQTRAEMIELFEINHIAWKERMDDAWAKRQIQTRRTESLLGGIYGFPGADTSSDPMTIYYTPDRLMEGTR